MKRIYLSIVVTVIGSLIALGWGLDYIFQSQSKNHELNQFLAQAHGIALSLQDSPASARAEQVSKYSQYFQLPLTLTSSGSLALPAELINELNQQRHLLLESEQGAYVLVPITSNNSQDLLQIALPFSESSSNRKLELTLTIIFYLGICTSLALWLIPLTRRLMLLNRAANQFGQGHLEARVPISRFSYIATLEASFNRMANQVNELVAENKLLADSLSHDLRTPLACLRFGIDAAISTQDHAKQQEYLERVEDEIERMEQMIDAFLEYGKIERQGLQLNKQAIAIDPLLADLINEFTPLATSQQLQLHHHSPATNVSINADQHWLYRLLLNLLANAIHYAKQQVVISAQVQANQLVIHIEDDGAGIPKDKQTEIFKPFTRLEKSRNRNSDGFGLGLAIVARICDWHNGTINVSSSKQLGGACFTLTLPLN